MDVCVLGHDYMLTGTQTWNRWGHTSTRSFWKGDKKLALGDIKSFFFNYSNSLLHKWLAMHVYWAPHMQPHDFKRISTFRFNRQKAAELIISESPIVCVEPGLGLSFPWKAGQTARRGVATHVLMTSSKKIQVNLPVRADRPVRAGDCSMKKDLHAYILLAWQSVFFIKDCCSSHAQQHRSCVGIAGTRTHATSASLRERLQIHFFLNPPPFFLSITRKVAEIIDLRFRGYISM